MIDKTYAETQGEAPFDWRSFLMRNDISSEEWRNARAKSISFVTCAVGNQCAIIPRGKHVGKEHHGPEDSELYILGLDFHAAICGQDVGFSLKVLSRIEARSAILIAEELAKRNAPQPK